MRRLALMAVVFSMRCIMAVGDGDDTMPVVDVDGRAPGLNREQVHAAYPPAAEQRKHPQDRLLPQFYSQNHVPAGRPVENRHLRKVFRAISQSAHERVETLRGLQDPNGNPLLNPNEVDDLVGQASRALAEKALREDMENTLPYTRARINQLENPGWKSDMVVGIHEKVVNPVMAKYYANKDIIDLIAKMTIIVSGMAYIFNKFGGTEWMRNKIREAFDKPSIYTERRRKKGWFGKKPESLLTEGDLILAPETRRQVNELIFLVNRRQELTQKTKKPLTLPRVLLWGPPGTAKTSIAQYIADMAMGDDGKPMVFIRLMASDFMQVKAEGDRIAVLKEMFEKARRRGNTIIFLDEVDGMTGQRGKEKENANRGFLDHLLDEIAKPSTQFMVIAATNHIGRIDNALLSRFTRQIGVGLPPPRQRKMILDLYVDRLLTSKGYKMEVSTANIAVTMKGSPGRELEAFVERLKERLDFLSQNIVTKEISDEVLREMGKLPPLTNAAVLDLEEEMPGMPDISAGA